MVEFCILFFFVLLAGVLHEEQVCSVSAERAWVANKDITLAELDAMALLADRCLQKVANPAIVWLARLVFVVGNASVDGRTRVWIVHTVVKDAANAPIWASDGDVAETDGNVAALGTRVAHIADHGVGASNVLIALVRIS